jgi:hypothetical protein
MGHSKMGQVFQMNLVFIALAKRAILGSEFKRVGEAARAEFRKVRSPYPLLASLQLPVIITTTSQLYPPPLCCHDCSETFVLNAELVRHRKFGCATERTRERLLAEQERQQRILQAALGKRLREVVRLKPGEVLGEEKEEEEEYSEEEEEEEDVAPTKPTSGSRRK